MISFSQILIILLLGLLLFGDLRKILNRILLLFVNFKTFFQKSSDTKESSSKVEKNSKK